MSVRSEILPETALLQRYVGDPKNYTDCFIKDVAGDVSLADFLTAFYTTRLFRAERFILKHLVRKPSTDADVAAIAQGETDRFAVWTLVDRTDTQVLLCDLAEHTRSWFMVQPTASGTRLYFGSAVTPGDTLLIKLTAPLHKLYSRLLLGNAKPLQSVAAGH
jgi:hypothetical protein